MHAYTVVDFISFRPINYKKDILFTVHTISTGYRKLHSNFIRQYIYTAVPIKFPNTEQDTNAQRCAKCSISTPGIRSNITLILLVGLDLQSSPAT